MEGIVGAGGLAPQALRERGIERIPLLKVKGETLLARACRCLIEGGGCERVHVLVPAEVPLPDHPAVLRAAYTGDIVSDVMRVARELKCDTLLLCSGDSPLLTPEAVAAVCQAGRESGADVVYPITERRVVEKRFPETKRTYVKLVGLTVTGGNLFWFSREWLASHGDLIQHLFASRKNPVGLARVFGLNFLLRFLLGRASLPWIEARLGRVLGGKLRAAVLPFPELAVDLDKLADLELYEPYLDPWR